MSEQGNGPAAPPQVHVHEQPTAAETFAAGAAREAATPARAAPAASGREAGLPFPKPPDRPTPGVRYEIETSSGGTIGVKWFNALDRLRFFELLGPQNSINYGVISIALPAYLVSDLNGKGFPRRPSTRSELEGRIAIIGDDLDTVFGVISPFTDTGNVNADELKNE